MCRYEIMTLGLCLNFQYVTVTVEDDLNCFESEITINELFVKKKKHNYKQVLSFLIKQLASALNCQFYHKIQIIIIILTFNNRFLVNDVYKIHVSLS